MRILIDFGTTEGHTKKLAEFVVSLLAADGFHATVRDLGRGDGVPNPADFQAVFVAGSLHVGRYQSQVVRFARAHHEALSSRPSAFISISLSAAGGNANDWARLSECVKRFERDTLWSPRAVHHAAGAIRLSQHGFVKRLAMGLIARHHGYEADRSRDHDLTDYGALTRFVEAFVSQLSSTCQDAARRP